MRERRFAGELHDSVIASLSAVKFRIEKIEDELTRGNCDPEALREIPKRITAITDEIRRIMADLRPAVLDDLGLCPP